MCIKRVPLAKNTKAGNVRVVTLTVAGAEMNKISMSILFSSMYEISGLHTNSEYCRSFCDIQPANRKQGLNLIHG